MLAERHPDLNAWLVARQLTKGQFYVGTDGTKFIKAATPMCLSYHPAAPLTEEEVIARARADR
jgi:hypothetical protein